ncbi:oligosaccharide repeat unit polymerase, partial [Methanocaldococcus sp.]
MLILGHASIILIAIFYLMLSFNISLNNLIMLIKVTIFILIHIIFFSLPFLLNIKLDDKTLLYSSAFFLFILSIHATGILGIFYFIFMLATVELYLKYKDSPIFNRFMFFIGVLSFLGIIFKYREVPIFNYNIRMAINNEPLRLISMGALTFSSLENKFYLIISFILLFLLGYKAGILILLFSYIIYKKYDIKRMLIYGFFILILLALMSGIILLSSNQNLNILSILCYRAYLDLLVLSKILDLDYHTWGKIILTPGGEAFIGEILFNYRHNFTTTFFGTLYLDFSYLSLLISFLLGLFS